MNTEEKILAVLNGRAWQYAVIPAKEIAVEEAVREACRQNYCGFYGKSWSCPPGAGELGDIKEEFSHFDKVFVFTTKSELEDSFDYEGMQAAAANHKALTAELLPLCTDNGLLLLGPGGCTLCEKCTYPAAPCCFPEKRIRSLEGSGVNVVELSKTCGINYINGANTVTYFSAVLYTE